MRQYVCDIICTKISCVSENDVNDICLSRFQNVSLTAVFMSYV